MTYVHRYVAALCAASCLMIAASAPASVAKPIGRQGADVSGVELVASSSYSRY